MPLSPTTIEITHLRPINLLKARLDMKESARKSGTRRPAKATPILEEAGSSDNGGVDCFSCGFPNSFMKITRLDNNLFIAYRL